MNRILPLSDGDVQRRGLWIDEAQVLGGDGLRVEQERFYIHSSRFAVRHTQVSEERFFVCRSLPSSGSSISSSTYGARVAITSILSCVLGMRYSFGFLELNVSS